MKLTALILLLGCLHVSAGTRSQTVSISGKDLPLTKVFNLIKKQTGYTVFGKSSLLRQSDPVTVSAVNMPLAQFLETVMQNQPIGYRLIDRTIFLVEKSMAVKADKPRIDDKAPPDWVGESGIRQVLTGIVVGENNNAVEGASINVKGKGTGVSTDSKGKFTISAESDQVLVFSHINFHSREIKVKDFPANGRVVLKQKEATLTDIVVTGYGNVRKESFTGTYTQVTKADLQKVTANNLIGALQVFDPSFRIMQNNIMGSNPNVLPEFYIRGQSGFPGMKELDKIQSGSSSTSQFALKNNPNTPIFIMDGFEVSVEKIYDMDINRISNITILKDAAATAMYGSRASNGVVVIETVLPKPGEFRVNYNGNYSVTAPDLSSYNMMNAQEKLDAEFAAKIYEPAMAPTDPGYESGMIEGLWKMQQKKNEVLKGVNTYWLSQPLSTMFNHKHNVYIEGGSQGMRVGVDLKYDQQNGVMKDSYRKRMGAGLTLQYQTTKLQFRNQIYFDAVNSEESPYGKFSDYSRLQPYFNMYDELTGKYAKELPNYNNNSVLNPMYESTVGNFDRTRYKEWTNNFTANWFLTKFLFIKGQFALEYKDSDNDRFISPESSVYARGDLFTKGELNQTSTKNISWNSNVFASYNRNYDVHNLNVSAGVNARSVRSEFTTSTYKGFANRNFNSPSYAYEISRKPELNDNITRLIGSFATLNYSYNNIYLFDGSFRMDGSSEFGTDNKWAPFWSVGAGVNLHNTHFLKSNSAINMLRLTANIGQTGKSNFSPYMARNTYQIMLDDWYPTGIGSSLTYMGNNKLTWEKQVSWNLGANLTLFKRYNVELNYYRKRTYDLITDVSLPSSSGFTVYRDNIGEVLNKGFEIKTSLNLINQKNFNFTLIGNMSHNRNEILKIAQSMKRYNNRIDEYYDGYNTSTDPALVLYYNEQNAKFAKPIMKYEEGSSLTTIYGMRSLGINPANGKEVYQKPDGSITYDWNPANQQPIGNTEPWAQGSFGLNARYKQFTLFTTFMFEFGGDLYNQTLVDNVENSNLAYYNADKRVLSERWQNPGDISTLKDIKDRYLVTRPTSRFLQQNNTVVFNSLSLGYDFDAAWLKRKFGMSFLRTTLLMNDVARFSSVKREMGLNYPYARTFTLTINASF
ncbi:SusC/RagA family TonB-linked outer membrane protein [Pseudoflavitalea sp. G-6-1-2]|uniref:SusC/RagA family TonB-linked outer membrane protein n=1 Tax=Pseudoflavitalea sp. G-6-1-2 TaxID=2728841 RepID=UPI001469E595|nr:SusC/RagA family TonB-linked outer membrane protein [Pseudoflavitalea sp. G-6-1-2]NML22285.1 SusC/RagA family TonB-linked outer membrane protein [Pseudoflavitalea sp. G-6-1-2]